MCSFFYGAFIEVAAQVPFFQEYFLLRKNESIQINAILQEKGRLHVVWHVKGALQLRWEKPKTVIQPKQGLENDVVTALAEDSLGRIWIGYDNGKVGFFQSDSFQIFDPPEGSATKTISDILFDSKGNLWFSTLNDGLYYFTSNRLYRVDEAEGMPDLYIYDLAEDAAGNIWAGTDGGAAVCTLQGNKISIQVIDYNDGLPDNIIRKIIPENDHTVLLATEDAGIIRYDFSSKKQEDLIDHTWSYGPVSDIEIKDDKIWIGVPQKGLLVHDRNIKTGNFISSGTNSWSQCNSNFRERSWKEIFGLEPSRVYYGHLAMVYNLSKGLSRMAVPIFWQ